MATETVYGLAADATNAEAVARIYEAKGRPSFNPLIVHVPDLAAAERIGEFGERRVRLPSEHWPGPLTLVVPLRARCRHRIDRHRRPADDRPARAGPSGDAGTAARDRPAARRALGQRQRLDQPDARRACAEKPRRPHSADHRRRPDRARARIDHRRRDRRAAAAAAAGPDRDRCRERRSATGSRRPGQLASHYAPAKPLRLDADERGRWTNI